MVKKLVKINFYVKLKREHVIVLTVYDDSITEICSSPPNQLYFKDADYDINCCYHVGTPNEDYYQCC